MGCMKTGKYQDGYSESRSEVRQFYQNVRILFCSVALNTSYMLHVLAWCGYEPSSIQNIGQTLKSSYIYK